MDIQQIPVKDVREFDMHIAFGVDANYLPPMAAAIASIAQHNSELKFAFHVMASDFSACDREMLARFADDRGLTIQIHDADCARLAKLPDPAAYTRAIYNRFLICDVLDGAASRVLYLDSDIICLGGLAELAALDMGGKIVAAVPDVEQATRKSAAGIKGDEPYFNSGVLYIDVEKWNARGITSILLETLEQNRGHFPMLDQDALNTVLKGEILFLDRKWNVLIDHYPVSDNTVFLHYAGGKPWQMWSQNYRDPRFTAALARTPWAGWHSVPKSRKHRNKYAQHLFCTGKILQACYWYMLFLGTVKKRQKIGKPLPRVA